MAGSWGAPRRPNVLLITLDQFRGDCLSCGRASDRSDAASRRLAAERRAVRPALQPGLAVRARAGVAVHGHVPVQPPRGRQRHAARPAVRQRRPRRAPGRLRAGRCSATPTSRSTHATPTGPDDPRLSFYDGHAARVRLSSSTFPTNTQPWLDWLAELGYDDVGRCRLRLLATEHERPEEHSVGAFLTDRAIDWIGRPGPSRGSPTSATSGRTRRTRRPASGRTAYDPADVGEPIPPIAGESTFHELVLIDRRRVQAPDRPRRAGPACAPSTSG